MAINPLSELHRERELLAKRYDTLQTLLRETEARLQAIREEILALVAVSFPPQEKKNAD